MLALNKMLDLKHIQMFMLGRIGLMFQPTQHFVSDDNHLAWEDGIPQIAAP